MKFPRLALISITLVASTVLLATQSHAITSVAPNGLPLYQFSETGTGPLPWNAASLEIDLNSTTMLGGPHGATSATEGVLAYRTNQSELALYVQTSTGARAWRNYTAGNDVPEPGDDPIPFFDPSGNVDLLYVDVTGHVVLASPNEADTPQWARQHYGTPWRKYVSTDLSALTGVDASNGLPSIQVSGPNATVAYRTTNDEVEVLTLSWGPNDPLPIYNQSAATVNYQGIASTPAAPQVMTAKASATTTTTTKPATTTTSTSTTTTTNAPPTIASAFASDPVVVPGATSTFAAILNNGDLVVDTNEGSNLDTWTSQDLTTLVGAPVVTGTLALGASSAQVDLAALTSAGDVELFSTGYLASGAEVSRQIASPGVWNESNITNLASGAPPLSGTLSVQVTPTQIAIAGQAANWGDLFVLTSPTGSTAWTATNVSVTAGSSARTVGSIVTGLQISGNLTLYAAGVNSPPPQGVGVYAIPSTDWPAAITSGWPIISETGGLGTRSSPWVGFTRATNVNESPDFLLGQAIYNSHKRVTWLSFWTVSGPLSGQPTTTTNYYAHGFAAGVWVATQIDAYRSLGVGLKPDWVILDPEGYPDDHSGLDAPGGASQATLAQYATYWSAMLQGWSSGIDSVDPSLNAAVYASQSEYRNYQLASLPMPVFVALAFGNGGPVPVAGATGSNVRGFITFNASCTPATTLQSEAATLEDPPWAGQFNTLQFHAGVYCSPPPT
ncbi:MAG: hypothetical protein ACRDVC_01465 [Acidimicrobiales bacterium]